MGFETFEDAAQAVVREFPAYEGNLFKPKTLNVFIKEAQQQGDTQDALADHLRLAVRTETDDLPGQGKLLL